MIKQISKEDIQFCKEHIEKLKEKGSKRIELFNEMEDIYFLNATDMPTRSWIKKTISPDPRIAIVNAARIMTAADPRWSVPPEFNTDEVNAKSSPLEKTAAAIWTAACRIQRKIIHYDLIISGLLYGEEHLAIISTRDMLEGAKTDWQKRRAERAAKATPILFDVLNPKLGFPDFDRLGLSSYASERKLKMNEIRTMYPEWADKHFKGKKPSEEFTFREYWNEAYHLVYLTEFEDAPIIAVEHDMPAIPIIVQVTEGSGLFIEDNQDNTQPFLYTLNKSKIWDRQNLALTVMYSNLFSMGANPTFVYKRNRPDKTVEDILDTNEVGGWAILDKDEDVGQMQKEVISQSLSKALEIANDKMVESTMYKQAFGEPIGANAPFSMFAMLSQAGRLPLVPYQKTTNFALSDAMHLAFDIIRKEGGERSVVSEEGTLIIEPKEIPENFEIFATLSISLPQDERQNVIMATQGTFGDNPLFSKKYAREKILSIEQSDDMDEEIWREKFSNMAAQMEFQKQQLVYMERQRMMEEQMRGRAASMVAGQYGGGQGGVGQPPMAPAYPQPPMPPTPESQMPGDVLGRLAGLQGTSAMPGVPGVPLESPLQPPYAAPLGTVPNVTGQMPFATPEEEEE